MYTYDRRIGSSPFAAFDTPEKVEGFTLFTRRLAWWLGMATPAGIKDVLATWKADPFLRAWLTQHVNPATVTLYHGKRWETEEPLPSVGDLIPRSFRVLQWSQHEAKARWFAGMVSNAKPDGAWRGGVVSTTTASSAKIIVDVDRFSAICGRFRDDALPLVHDSARDILNGSEWEGEVLTTGPVKSRVIAAQLF